MSAPYIDAISDWLEQRGPIRNCDDLRACCADLEIDEEMFFGVLGNAVHKGFVVLAHRTSIVSAPEDEGGL